MKPRGPWWLPAAAVLFCFTANACQQNASPEAKAMPSEPKTTAGQTPALVAVTVPPRTPSPAPPLLILLHGYGSNEQDLLDLAGQLDPRFAVVSVQAPYAMGPGSHAWFSLEFLPGGNNRINVPEWEQSTARLAAFITTTVAAVHADPQRVFVAGFSQGGMMALTLALTRPRLLAGAVVMSGRLIPEVMDRRAGNDALKDFPLLVVHGTQDPRLPVALARTSRDTLQGLPVQLGYQEFPMGHTITAQSLHTVDLWLREQLDRVR